jgi:hypothetical protein
MMHFTFKDFFFQMPSTGSRNVQKWVEKAHKHCVFDKVGRKGRRNVQKIKENKINACFTFPERNSNKLKEMDIENRD